LANRERAKAARDEEGGERREHAAESFDDRLANAIDERARARDDSADDVAMASEPCRHRVHDEIGTVLERRLRERRRKGAVDDDERRGEDRLRERGDPPDVDDTEGRIGRRLDVEETRRVGDRGGVGAAGPM
jgi:hypothetical protein